MMNPNVRPASGPSALLYVLAFVIILGGFVGGVVQCANTFMDYNEWLTYVTVPGSGTITLSEPGKYTLYHEHVTVLDGRPYTPTGGQPSELDFTLTNKSTGKQIPLTSPGSNETYTLGERQGVAFMVFTVDTPGEYELTGTYRDGRSEPKLVMAVGKDVVKRILKGIVMPMVLIGAGIVIGIVLIIITAVGRGRAKRAAYMYQQQQMMPPPPPPGQFPGPGMPGRP